ncbi:hypothetical protein D9M69_623480 [compost metagenome]
MPQRWRRHGAQRQRHGGHKSHLLERQRARQTSGKKQAQDGGVNAQLVAVGFHEVHQVARAGAVPVEEAAQLDAQVGHDARRVRGVALDRQNPPPHWPRPKRTPASRPTGGLRGGCALCASGFGS